VCEVIRAVRRLFDMLKDPEADSDCPMRCGALFSGAIVCVPFRIKAGDVRRFFLEYQCRNCQNYTKAYAGGRSTIALTEKKICMGWTPRKRGNRGLRDSRTVSSYSLIRTQRLVHQGVRQKNVARIGASHTTVAWMEGEKDRLLNEIFA